MLCLRNKGKSDAVGKNDLVKCLSNMNKGLNLIPSTQVKSPSSGCDCSPSAGEAETRGAVIAQQSCCGEYVEKAESFILL